MKIAQDPGRRRIDGGLQQFAPERAERVALAIGNRGIEAWQEPVDQQLSFDQERVHIVGRNAIVQLRRDWQRVGQLLLMQREQHVDRDLIALLDRRWWLAADHTLVAEVLDDQKSLLEIRLINAGRG